MRPTLDQLASQIAKLRGMMSTKRDRHYEVGYGKPPQHTRFKKGQSGNPKGRPLGCKNSATLLREALGEQVVVSENGRRMTMSKKQAIIKQIVNKAASGDHRSIQLLLLSQLPLIEGYSDSSGSAAVQTPVLPVQQSMEQKRARALEIAKILKDIGYLDQVLNAPPESASAIAPSLDADKK